VNPPASNDEVSVDHSGPVALVDVVGLHPAGHARLEAPREAERGAEPERADAVTERVVHADRELAPELRAGRRGPVRLAEEEGEREATRGDRLGVRELEQSRLTRQRRRDLSRERAGDDEREPRGEEESGPHPSHRVSFFRPR